jgi:hypothetical protein
MFDKLKKKERFLEIWKNRANSEIFTTEEKHIADAMEEHREYHKLWNSGDIYQVLNHPGDEDPFYHVVVHSILEQQAEMNSPEEVGDALQHLLKKGASRHEAVHAMGVILADEMFEMLRNQKPFDNDRYRQRLGKFLDT